MTGKGRGTIGSGREMEDRLLHSPYSLARKPWQISVLLPLLVLPLLPCSGTHWAALTNELPTSVLWVSMVVNRLWALELSTRATCHSSAFSEISRVWNRPLPLHFPHGNLASVSLLGFDWLLGKAPPPLALPASFRLSHFTSSLSLGGIHSSSRPFLFVPSPVLNSYDCPPSSPF